MDIVKINHLIKKYNNKTVIKDISLKIESGEIFGLLGPSGSGKTTLVKHIVGIENATSGEVSVFNQLMPNRAIAKDIGYMGQNDALYEELTGYENLSFFASLYEIKQKDIKKKIISTFEMLDLSEDLHKKVNQYSGGMKKRLSLAIAIIHNPKILILDEPTVGIDPVLRQIIWKKFYEMRDNGTTLIVTTHIMEEIEKCDKAALIRNGHIMILDTICNLKAQTKSGKIEELFFTRRIEHENLKISNPHYSTV